MYGCFGGSASPRRRHWGTASKFPEGPAPGQRVEPKDAPPKKIADFESLQEIFSASPDFFFRIDSEKGSVGQYRPGDVVAVNRNLEPR